MLWLMEFGIWLLLKQKGLKKSRRNSRKDPTSVTTSQSCPIEDVPEAASLTFVGHDETKFGVFFKTTSPRTDSLRPYALTHLISFPPKVSVELPRAVSMSVGVGWMNSVMSILEFALTYQWLLTRAKPQRDGETNFL